jgi:RND family efflux transporter MFP subunit
VQGAEASVRHNQEEITRAQHELASAEAVHGSLHAASERLKQASAARPGLIAAQELDDADGRDRASEAQVEAAKSSLSAARQQLDVSKADNLHYSALSSYAKITAPFSGVVTWRYSDTGSLVQSGTSSSSSQPVVKLAEVDVLRLRLPVPESLATFIHAGTVADISVQATGEHLTGKVTRLADNFDRTTRTMQVEIDIPNRDGKLTPGMYADVKLQSENRPDAITVPVQALIREGSKASVMVVTPRDHLEEREVKTGIESAYAVEIVSGLKEGERVVVGNPRSFQPGQTVQPIPSQVDSNSQGGQ